MSHVHELRVENFKRIEAVAIPFAPRGTTEIVGKNAQGKSSAIDALWAAIGGKDVSPSRPIRKGAHSASVEVRLVGVKEYGELRVERRWDERGESKLTVTGPMGMRCPKPQALLDGLIAKLAFDPMDFTRQKPEKQAETLRRVAGLDFTAIDERKDRAYRDRTEVNKELRAIEARFKGRPAPEAVEPVDVSAIRARLSEAQKANALRAKARAEVQQKSAAVERLRQVLPENVVRAQKAVEKNAAEESLLNDEIERLERRLADVRAQVARLQDQRGPLRASYEQACAEHIAAIKAAGRQRDEMAARLEPDVDLSALLDEIEQAERTNERARDYERYQAAVAEHEATRRHSEELTATIEQCDRERQQMLAEAVFPVPGLSLDGETITFHGVPFDQISTAEQIRVSLAMSASLNSDLHLILIKEGSLLDGDNLRLVSEWAEERGYQVIIERVADSTVGAGVIIEEGRIKSQTLEPEAALA